MADSGAVAAMLHVMWRVGMSYTMGGGRLVRRYLGTSRGRYGRYEYLGCNAYIGGTLWTFSGLCQRFGPPSFVDFLRRNKWVNILDLM